MARPFLLLTILNDAGSLHAIPPGADAEISGHAPLVAELVGHANQTTTNDMADGACSRRRVPEGVFPSAAGGRSPAMISSASRGRAPLPSSCGLIRIIKTKTTLRSSTLQKSRRKT